MRFHVAAGVAVGLLVSVAASAQAPFGTWSRPVDQPVIRPVQSTVFSDPVTGQTVHWEALHTFNPAAVVRNGNVYVLYRAEDDSGSMMIGGHVSRLGLAVSSDGIHFQQMPQPVLFPAKDAQEERESPGGVEDPRIVEAPDGTYVLTYTQWSRKLARYSVGIATSRDLQHWQKQGPAFLGSLGGRYDTLKYKSAAILTERKGDRLIAAKVNGRYWMFWGDLGIRLATSDDLIHWTPVESAPGEVKVVLKPRPGLPDSDFPEAGPPPVLTKQGIVMLYNGKNKDGEGKDPALKAGTYAVLQAVLSATDPSTILTRTDTPVFKPELPFEQSGQYAAGTTFSEGLVLFKGKWFLYYGCADSFVGVATASGT